MKKSFLALLLTLAPLSLLSQEAPYWVTRQSLLLENTKLKFRIDSLRAVIDSLSNMYAFGDSTVLAVLEGNDAAPDTSYTAEVSDSLMNIWFERRRTLDSNEVEGGSVEDTVFTSKVSDEVMMQRLKDMNPFITLPFNSTVKNYMILYSEKSPAKMSRVMGYAQYYMPIFEQTFDKYGLPIELKYMAVIESSLNPVARSRAGARGMWQFMYTTAKSYGLKINSFVDERLEVEKAVDAAARYLRDSYKVFGDWSLAISSYNCGAANVQKAIRRAGSRNFWDVYDFLPRETRGYVPAFVGAMYAMTYSKEYGIDPDEVGMPAVTDTFEIHRNLHFKQINEVVGVPVEMIRNLNPQYTHDIIPGNEGTCILRLPYSWSGAFVGVNRDSLYLHKSAELLSPQVIKNIQESGSEVRTAYRVKSGDYLGKIASRYHVSVKDLMRWNHLRSSNLRVGQVLYIYHRGAAPAASTQNSAASSSATSTKSSTYVVKSGDTLYGIAKKYPGLSAQDIMNANGMKSSAIKPGVKLKIPAAK